MNILIIDDDPDYTEDLVYKIRDLPLKTRVMSAVSVDDALECLAVRSTPHIDFLFLDECMPGDTGSESLPGLRMFEKAEGAKAIMMTGLADDRTRARALASGFDAFLEKPASEKLLTRILVERKVFWDLHDLPYRLDAYWDIKASLKNWVEQPIA